MLDPNGGPEISRIFLTEVSRVEAAVIGAIKLRTCQEDCLCRLVGVLLADVVLMSLLCSVSLSLLARGQGPSLSSLQCHLLIALGCCCKHQLQAE